MDLGNNLVPSKLNKINIITFGLHFKPKRVDWGIIQCGYKNKIIINFMQDCFKLQVN